MAEIYQLGNGIYDMLLTDYLMESEEEALRLDLKTDPEVVQQHALWAGLKPGMRVADLGCGSGKTSYHLNLMAKPNGETIGVDIAEQRYRFAREHYLDEGLSFALGDIRKPMPELGQFDFIWIRFVLEYYRTNSFDILRNVLQLLKPGGILCLVDLDYNCLTHYGIPEKLNETIHQLITSFEKNFNFDPYTGRKLYSYIYDLGLTEIDVKMEAHHLIYGPLKKTDEFNWMKKIEIARRKTDGSQLERYEGGFDKFCSDFHQYFNSPRRFTYTPVFVCRGRKPER